MPRARKEPPDLDPNVTYVAWQGFAADVDGLPVDVKQGTRLRGNHPTVEATWWNWLPDGAAPSELAERVRQVYPEPEVHVEAYERAKQPPLRDEDAMVCARPVSDALALNQKGLAPGVKVPKFRRREEEPRRLCAGCPGGALPRRRRGCRVHDYRWRSGGGARGAVA